MTKDLDCVKIFVGVSDLQEIFPISRHLLIDIHGADPQKLNDLEFVKQTLIRAAEKAGAHIVGTIFHPFLPQGITGVVAVEESHLSTHNWPEYDYAAVDIFFCGDRVDLSIAAAIIKEALSAQEVDMLMVIRGPKKKFLNKT